MKIFKTRLYLIAIALILVSCNQRSDWYGATRESAGIAPDPATSKAAVVQIYGADTWGWRGWFAIHTWISVKRKNENFYTVYDVTRWRNYGGRGVVGIYRDIPDRHWFGARPRLLGSHQGQAAEAMIEAVDQAARNYPWKSVYRAFPGPNSNTFTAWVLQQVPTLKADLPWSAIGSGYIHRQ